MNYIMDHTKTPLKMIEFFSLMLFSLLVTNTYNVNSQTAVSDKQQFRALYEFTQKAEKDRDAIVIIDTMELKIGDNWSVYKEWRKDVKDSLKTETIRNIDMQREIVTHYGTYDEFISNSNNADIGFWNKSWETANLYKDRSNNKIIIFDEIDKVGLFKLEDHVSQEWDISTDTLNIQSYLCYKAVTSFRGREYTAWFTLEIPINEGPWKFYGLPGLILDVQDKDEIFKITLIGFEKADNNHFIAIDETAKYDECTLEQYNKLKRNTFKNARYYNMQGSHLNMYSGDNRTKRNFFEK